LFGLMVLVCLVSGGLVCLVSGVLVCLASWCSFVWSHGARLVVLWGYTYAYAHRHMRSSQRSRFVALLTRFASVGNSVLRWTRFDLDEGLSMRFGDQCLFHRHLGAHTRPVWAQLGPIFLVTCIPLGPFWIHVGHMLGPLWAHYGSILGPWPMFGPMFGRLVGPLGDHIWTHYRPTKNVLWFTSNNVCPITRNRGDWDQGLTAPTLMYMQNQGDCWCVVGALFAPCLCVVGALLAPCWRLVGALLARCFFLSALPALLLARCWRVGGALLVRCLRLVGAFVGALLARCFFLSALPALLLARCWRAVGALLARVWTPCRVVGALLVRCLRLVGALLVPCWRAVSSSLPFLHCC
jgi:hypothetical protein